MDTLILILAAIIMCLGIAGSFLPVLPGPLTSWVGFIVLDASDSFSLSSTFIIITGIISAVIFILDYAIPAMGTKKFGGSRYGVIGTTLGLIIGLFLFIKIFRILSYEKYLIINLFKFFICFWPKA